MPEQVQAYLAALIVLQVTTVHDLAGIVLAFNGLALLGHRMDRQLPLLTVHKVRIWYAYRRLSLSRCASCLECSYMPAEFCSCRICFLAWPISETSYTHAG